MFTDSGEDFMPSRTHGESTSAQYVAWLGMKARCTRPSHKRYARYGGRGITICDRWLDYSNFLADMGERPEGMSIERIDNDKGYSPENCVWATPAQQARNRSQNINLTFDGVTMCLKDWANETGVPYPTIYDRYRRGFTVARILQVSPP